MTRGLLFGGIRGRKKNRALGLQENRWFKSSPHMRLLWPQGRVAPLAPSPKRLSPWKGSASGGLNGWWLDNAQPTSLGCGGALGLKRAPGFSLAHVCGCRGRRKWVRVWPSVPNDSYPGRGQPKWAGGLTKSSRPNRVWGCPEPQEPLV